MRLKELVTPPAVAAALFSGVLASADDRNAPSMDREARPVEPDSTGMNERGRYGAGLTADDQAFTGSDNELLARVRRSIVEDDSLSSYAHNIKILANDGKVTLKGPVRSEAEKRSVIEKASRIAGSRNVTSEIMIDAD